MFFHSFINGTAWKRISKWNSKSKTTKLTHRGLSQNLNLKQRQTCRRPNHNHRLGCTINQTSVLPKGSRCFGEQKWRDHLLHLASFWMTELQTRQRSRLNKECKLLFFPFFNHPCWERIRKSLPDTSTDIRELERHKKHLETVHKTLELHFLLQAYLCAYGTQIVPTLSRYLSLCQTHTQREREKHHDNTFLSDSFCLREEKATWPGRTSTCHFCILQQQPCMYDYLGSTSTFAYIHLRFHIHFFHCRRFFFWVYR